MIKRISIIIYFAIISISSFAQYANNWINYSQKYYKFPIVSDGVYRITYSDLANAGVNISAINSPKNYQIYGRGEEVAIYVHNENSGVFTSSDYIEFYAQKNDGWYDAELYKHPSYQPNTDYSFYTDTAYYYFTFNSSVANKRLQIVNDNNFAAYNVSDYFIYNSNQYFSQFYIEGEKATLGFSSAIEISDPHYVNGEGWYYYPISLGGSVTKSVSTKNVYQNGPIATAYYEIMGASNFAADDNPPNHHTRIEIANTVLDTLFYGYNRLVLSQNISNTDLGNSSTSFTFSSINDINSGADRFAFPYIKIKYAHTPALENKSEFYMDIADASGQSKSYFVFSDFNGGNNPFVYDLSNDKKIQVTKDNNNYKVLIPNGGANKKCVISNVSNIKSIGVMRPVSANAKFNNIITQNPTADYIIISNSSLMGVGTLATVNNYANYRNQKGQNTLVVDVEELYHQFAYGIRKNPMAVRNFVIAMGGTYGFDQFDGLFIVGKSYRASEYRKNATLFKGTIVPTFGSPPSDVLMVAGIVDNLYTPAIPIGRLSAKTLDHVDLYLDKIKLHEDQAQFPYDMWMKKILHFSGGSNSGEQHSISVYLNNYKDIAQDTFYGASVTTFSKTTTDPIQINLSDLIKYHVNNGVSLMTFFGHAAGVGFDISIDHPSEYDNYGKYPLLLANSCFAGDIFQNTQGSVNSAEEFVLIRDKGMIGYIASVTSMRLSQLNLYSNDFYKSFSSKYYGEPIGKMLKKVITSIQAPEGKYMEVCLEMTLHGDPLIKFRTADKPDFAVKQSSVFYSPEIVSTAIDSFDYNLVIKNIGRAVNDSIIIEVSRTYAKGDSIDRYAMKVPSPKNTDTITLRMPVNRAFGIGDNIVSANVDAYSNVDESDEGNNIVVSKLNIKAADLSPVYPPRFSIVSSSNVTLKASTFYPFTPLLDYVFEIDTSVYFNSPLKLSHKIASTGGVIEWSSSLTLTDNTVYYWRVSLDSNAQHDFNWRNSSFEYVDGKSGWSQAHFMQFEDNNYQFTRFIENDRTFKFVDDINIISAQTGTYPTIPWTEVFLKFNQSIVNTWACMPTNTTGILQFHIINPVNGEQWKSENLGGAYGPYDNLHCKSYKIPHLDYPTQDANIWAGVGLVKDTVWFRRVANLIASVPDGYKVMVMSVNNPHTNTWPEYLYKAFDSIGSNYIRNYPNKMPFIIYGTKGILGGANEISGIDDSSIILFKDSLKTNWNEGFVESPVIGPSLKWSSLNWQQHSLDAISSDSVRLQLIGIKADGSNVVIIDGLDPSVSEVLLLNDIMPSTTYPYCKLKAIMKDDINRTPVFMDSWRIYYKPAAEVAIDPISHFEFHSDTLMQGDSLSLHLAYRNIGDVDMDSLLVRTWIKDAHGIIIPLVDRKLRPITKNSILIDTFQVATMNLLGQCFLFVEINPINNSTGAYDQLEISHDNNTGDIPFFVKRDNENPLLDVTFDGIHILNGDIVSARPEVRITLRDESKFKAINDTTMFRVRVKAKGEDDYSNVNFSDISNVLEFIPAQLPDNSAEVVYRPELADGEYNLLIYANDASRNKSGDNGYKIDFTVVNKSTITQMMNWPNPFSDRTHFVFTLTGASLPDYLKIQIMTITGKIVREIDMNELGPLHIGRNITEYAWDGRDEYGDQLANGVYLYRVITRISGESIELRESGADKYFKKNFGKMYLMR